MSRFGFIVSAALASFLSLTLVANAAEPAKRVKTDKGEILVNPNGMALYTFDRDMGGKSACSGACATNWPPLMAKKDDKPSGSWTIIERDDGSLQWAYGAKPLYTWSKDGKAGDVTGDGVNGVWHVAKP